MVKNTKNISFEYHPKFCKEFNKIIRKHQCPTLEEDFEVFKNGLVDDLNSEDKLPNMYHRIAGLDSRVNKPAFIIKDFRCYGIKHGKKSGFRLVFVLYDFVVYFTEIYHKNRKTIEDKERINKLFK